MLDIIFDGDADKTFLAEAMQDFINFGAGNIGGVDQRRFGGSAITQEKEIGFDLGIGEADFFEGGFVHEDLNLGLRLV